MRRLLILATTIIIMTMPAWAVGTVNQSLAQIPGSTNYVFTENWTGDAATGSVPATTISGTTAIQGMRIVSVEVAPGSPAPTNNYTVTLTDFSGADILGGSGANQSSTTAAVLPSISNSPPIYGSLTVNVTGNSAASAQGRVLVYFAPVSQVFGNTPVGAGLTSNNLFTGTNTFTGTTSFTGPTLQLEGCQHVNSGQTFAAALAAVSNPGCIVVDPGTYAVGINATIPAGVSLISESGGLLSIANAITLTINGPIIAPAAQIFSYTGTGVALSNGLNPVTFYNWFPGADPGVQVNNAIAALSGRGIIWVTQTQGASTLTFTTNPFAGRTNADRIHLIFGSGIFQFSAAAPLSIVENTWIQGQGPRNTVLQQAGNSFVVQYCTNAAASPNPTGTCLGTTSAQSVIVSDLTLDGNSQSGSGCLLFQNFDLPSRAENIACQSFGSFGGFQFIQTTAAGAGGSGHNLWAIQSTAGTAGGTVSTAIPFTFDSVNHFECRKCFAQYAPAGVVIKNTQNVAPTEIVFVDFENEGIAINTGSTGVGLDLQANTNGVSVKGWSWLGPSSSAGTCLKTASTATNWDVQGFFSNRTNTTVFNINGTTYTPANQFVQHFSQGIMQNSTGLEVWTGTTLVPQDPTSPIEAFSNATNCLLLGDNGGTIHFATQCLTGQTTIGAQVLLTEIAAPAGAANNEVCYGDSTAHSLKCSYNNGTFFQIPQVITATSSAFATATTAGTCVQQVTAVTNAATTMAVSVSPVSTPGVGAVWSGFVSSAGNVTINECAVATSAGGTIAFNIRVTP